jgi:hypothetical protein
MPDAPLSYDQRRKVFSSIVGARAAGAKPQDYRPAIAERFGLTPEQLDAVEKKGTRTGGPRRRSRSGPTDTVPRCQAA